MLQIETQSDFTGFGTGRLPGECHHAVNMAPTSFGFAPFYKNTTVTTQVTITSLDLVRWFVEYSGTIWGLDGLGRVISKSVSWQNERAIAVASSGNGMIVDQTGRLLVVNDRYLTKYTGTWTESWKDLVTTVTGDKGMDTYLDWVVIPHGNKVALLNITDDSFNTAGLTLPTGCTALVAKSNKTGVLVGVNMGNRSFVLLWDAQSDRAITDWIWFDHPLKSICRASDAEWIVTTSKEIILTNGYTRKTLQPLPESFIGQVPYNPVVGGTVTIGNQFHLMHTDNGSTANYGRRKSGLFILNLDTNLWQFVPASDNATKNVTMGAIFEDSTSNVWLSHRNILTSTYIVSQLTNDVPSSAYFITAPFGQGNTRKVAEGAKVEIVANNAIQSYLPMTFTVSVKVYDYTRPLWTYGNQNGLAASKSILNVNGASGGFNNALVGDEVTILSGANAGQVRHITAIANQGTTTEAWTLNAALTNFTEDTVQFNVQPFKLAQKFVVTTSASIPVDGLYFNIQNRYKAKKYLLKVLFEDMSNAPLTVPAVTFIYNDLGII